MASNNPQFGHSMWSEIDPDIFKNIKDKPVQPSQEGANLQKSGDTNEPKQIDEGFKFNQISSDSQNKYLQQSKDQKDLSSQEKQNPEEKNLPSAMFHQYQQQFDWQAQESSQSQEPEYLRQDFQQTSERDFDMEQRLGQGIVEGLSKQKQDQRQKDLDANLKWSLGEEQKSFGQGDQPGLQRREEHLTSPQIDKALKQGLSSEKEEAIQSKEPYLQTQGTDKTRFGKQSHDFTQAAEASGANFERMEQKKDLSSDQDKYAIQLKERKQMEEENERKIEELEQRRMEEHPEQFACVPEILENKRGLDELEHQRFEEDKAAMGMKNVEYRKFMKEVQMKDRERQKQESREQQQQKWTQNQSSKRFMNKFCDCFQRWMQQKYGLKQGEESLGWDQKWESGFASEQWQGQSLMDRFCKCFERKLCDQYGWNKSQGSQLWQQQQQLQWQQQKLQQENVPLDTIGLMEKFGQSLKQQTASRVPREQEKIEEEQVCDDVCRRDWEGQDNMQQFINEGIKDQFLQKQSESLREQRDLKADKRSSSPERFKMPKQEQIQRVEGDSENEEDFSSEDDDETDQREEQKFEQSQQEEKGAIHKDIGLEIKDEDLQFLKEQQKKVGMSSAGGQEGKKKRRKRKAKKSSQEQQEAQLSGEQQQHQMKQIESIEGGKKMVPSEWFGDQSVLKRKLECTSEEHLIKEPVSRVNIEFKDTSLAKQKKTQKEGSAKKQPKKQEQSSQKQTQSQTTQTKQKTSELKSDIPPSSIQQQQQQTTEEWRSNSPSAKKKQADIWINQAESNLPKTGTFDLPKNWQQQNIAKQNQPSNEPKSSIEQKILERNIQESNEPKQNVI